MEIRSKGTNFWNWFKHNNERYLDLDTIDEAKLETLLDEFLYQLHQYCNKLFFQIGGDVGSTKELIISAEGNKDYFDQVEQLVAAAPPIAHWRIISLKPPVNEDFTTEHNGIRVSTKELWFLPMQNADETKFLGLRIYVPFYDQERRDDYLFIIYQILDSVLGEKSHALDIHQVDVGSLGNEPEKAGLLPLNKLPAYIKWKSKELK